MREYRVWRGEEEKALRDGVCKHGTGAWEIIRTDPDFHPILKERTGVQLKDKWRNLVKFRHLNANELTTISNEKKKPLRKAVVTEQQQPSIKRPEPIVAPERQPFSAALVDFYLAPLAHPSPSAALPIVSDTSIHTSTPASPRYRAPSGGGDTSRIDESPARIQWDAATRWDPPASAHAVMQHIRDYHGRKHQEAQAAFQELTVHTEQLTEAFTGLTDGKASKKRLVRSQARQKSVKDRWLLLSQDVQNAGLILDTVQEMYQNNEPLYLPHDKESICPEELLELLREHNAGNPCSHSHFLHVHDTPAPTPPLSGDPASVLGKRLWQASEDRRFGIYDSRRYDAGQDGADVSSVLAGVTIPRQARTARPFLAEHAVLAARKWVDIATHLQSPMLHIPPLSISPLTAIDQLGRGQTPPMPLGLGSLLMTPSSPPLHNDKVGDTTFDAGHDLDDFVEDLHRDFSMEDWEEAELAIRTLDGLARGPGPDLSCGEDSAPPLTACSPEHDDAASHAAAVESMLSRTLCPSALPLDMSDSLRQVSQGVQPPSLHPHHIPRAPGGPYTHPNTTTTTGNHSNSGHVQGYSLFGLPGTGMITDGVSRGLGVLGGNARGSNIVDAAMRPTARLQQPSFQLPVTTRMQQFSGVNSQGSYQMRGSNEVNTCQLPQRPRGTNAVDAMTPPLRIGGNSSLTLARGSPLGRSSWEVMPHSLGSEAIPDVFTLTNPPSILHESDSQLDTSSDDVNQLDLGDVDSSIHQTLVHNMINSPF